MSLRRALEEAAEVGTALLDEAGSKQHEEKKFSPANYEDVPTKEDGADDFVAEEQGNPFAAYNGIHTVIESPTTIQPSTVIEEQKEEKSDNRTDEEKLEAFYADETSYTNPNIKSQQPQPAPNSVGKSKKDKKEPNRYGAIDNESDEQRMDNAYPMTYENEVPDEGNLIDLDPCDQYSPVDSWDILSRLYSALRASPDFVKSKINDYIVYYFINLLAEKIKFNKENTHVVSAKPTTLTPANDLSTALKATEEKVTGNESACSKTVNAVVNNCIVWPFLSIFAAGHFTYLQTIGRVLSQKSDTTTQAPSSTTNDTDIESGVTEKVKPTTPARGQDYGTDASMSLEQLRKKRQSTTSHNENASPDLVVHTISIFNQNPSGFYHDVPVDIQSVPRPKTS